MSHMEDKLKNAKKVYDQTEVPPELDGRVREAIAQARPNTRRGFLARRLVSGAAAAAACFALALNLSPAFAASVGEVPVLGAVSRVLTIRHWSETEDNVTTTVDQPIVGGGSRTAERVNREIEKRVKDYTEQCEREVAEYKEAFLATGGTEEEWAERGADIAVRYEVLRETDSQISFMVEGYLSWFNFTNERQYYNLDLENDRELTLEDVLGEDYIERANAEVKRQIAERQADGQGYFSEEEGGFAGVRPDMAFYINEKGNPVLVFERYEIAAGCLGWPEFEIEK